MCLNRRLHQRRELSEAESPEEEQQLKLNRLNARSAQQVTCGRKEAAKVGRRKGKASETRRSVSQWERISK